MFVVLGSLGIDIRNILYLDEHCDAVGLSHKGLTIGMNRLLEIGPTFVEAGAASVSLPDRPSLHSSQLSSWLL